MDRIATLDLASWAQRKEHQPLVVRGARQVGKTWLVEAFARAELGAVATLDFERHPAAASLFSEPSPHANLRAIETLLGMPIVPGRCLLFLDEVQRAPEVLARLRYFREELAALHLIAAGSLLDFVLAQPTFSVPVGRIGYLHLEPMSFLEFLSALGEATVCDFVRSWRLDEPIPTAVHERLLGLVREYVIVGGMPAIVERYRSTRSWSAIAPLQHDLLATLRDDFHKYGTRASVPRLGRVIDAIPRLVGRKFTFSQVDRGERAAPLRQALDLLAKARVCHLVRATQAHGVPLASEVNDRISKVILLDTGLFLAALGIGAGSIQRTADLTLVNEGAVAEQLVGQMLRALSPSFIEPALFYWQRERRGAEAEVDYVIQHEGHAVPIEVKAGTTGTLRSLHLFVHERRSNLAVRISSAPPQLAEVTTALPNAARHGFRLLSLPFYLVSELPRLLAALG